MKNFLKITFSYIRAVLRLIVLTFVCFLRGLEMIVFSGVEVVAIAPVVGALSYDNDKLALVDSLNRRIFSSIGVDDEEDLGEEIFDDETK